MPELSDEKFKEYMFAHGEPQKCVSCAYMQKQPLERDAPIEPITETERQYWYNGQLSHDVPYCLAGHELMARIIQRMEIDPKTGESRLRFYQSSLEVAYETNDCEDWELHDIGLDPLWRLGQRRMKDLAEMQMKLDKELSESERKQARALARLDARIQKQTGKTAEILLEIQRNNQKDTQTSTQMFYLLGFITLVISVSALFFPSGLPGFKDDSGTRDNPSFVVQVTSTPQPTAVVGPLPGSR